jgi:hypothetical protein
MTPTTTTTIDPSGAASRARGRLLRRLVVATCALGVAVGAVPAAASAASTTIANVVLDAYDASSAPATTPVSSRAPLAKGRLYVATVKGTISYYAAINYVALQPPWSTMCGTAKGAPMYPSAGGSGPVGNDAEFIFAQPTAKATCEAGKLPAHWFNLEMNDGSGWKHPPTLSARPLAAPLASHAYSYPLVGHQKAARFRLADSDTRDDYGSFRISVRTATAADCAGERYKAFGTTTPAACVAATRPTGGPAPKRAAALPTVSSPVRVDQGPIARVLRLRDVADGIVVEHPSGALTVSQFVAVDNAGKGGAAKELAVLKGRGFRSAALVTLRTKDGLRLKSTTIKLGTVGQAKAVLAAEAALVGTTQAPAGTTAAAPVADGTVAEGRLVTFAPKAPGGTTSVLLLSRSGTYVYALQASGPQAVVSQAQVEQLLGLIASRS